MTPLVEAREVTKRFGPVVANDGVSLTLQAGEIHAVLGENGAGKTTLLNILSGVYQPDAGQVLIDGRPVALHSPADALRQGIGAVYQHFTLVPNLTVLENVVLGADGGFRLDLRGAERRVASLLREFRLAAPLSDPSVSRDDKLSPRTEIRHLALGQRQRVEIVKALYRESRVLLLDEPTSVLTPAEVDGLFAVLRRLRANGVAIALITHKLEEALAVSDRLTVLRHGQVVGEIEGGESLSSRETEGSERGAAGRQELAPIGRRGGEATRQHIIALMFGGLPPREAQLEPHVGGAALLSLRDVSAVDDRGAPAVRNCSFELHAGEIFGIAGVDGNGQKELAEVIAGQRRATRGHILRGDQDLTNRGVAVMRGVGVGYITDDRLGEGIVAGASVAENAVLKTIARRPFSRRFWLKRRAIDGQARRLIDTFDIRTLGPGGRAGDLSGGNIQKLLLARELALDPAVVVCNKPTAGLDLRTTRFVLHTLREQAAAGKAVLFISSELDELLEISDRIGVIYRGHLAAIVPRAEADPAVIGRVMLSGADRATA